MTQPKTYLELLNKTTMKSHPQPSLPWLPSSRDAPTSMDHLRTP